MTNVVQEGETRGVAQQAEQIRSLTSLIPNTESLDLAGGRYIDPAEVDSMFYMYSDRMKRVTDIVVVGDVGLARYRIPETYEPDPFTPENGVITPMDEDMMGKKKTGKYHLTVSPKHTNGHLVQADVMRAVDLALAGIQTSSSLLGYQLEKGQRLRVESIANAAFKKPVVPDDKLIILVTQDEENPLATQVKIHKEDPENPGEPGVLASELGKVTFAVEQADEEDGFFTETDGVEGSAQVLGIVHSTLAEQDGNRKLPLFGGFKLAQFTGRRVRQGQELATHGKVTKVIKGGFTGDTEMFVDGEVFGSVEGILCVIRDEEAILNTINAARPQAA